MNQQILALPIVFLRNKTFDLSHEEALFATVEHMINVIENHQYKGFEWITAYSNWDKGQFRKVVRRSTPQKFLTLSSAPDALYTAIPFSDNRIVELLSLPPRSIEDRDDRLKSMQVSGLNFEKKENIVKEDSNFFIAINDDLGASTGKMMAQVSHIIQIVLKSDLSDKVRKEINAHSFSLYSSFDDVKDFETLFEIRDAGFTEIEPNSLTAIAGFKK